MHVPFRLLLLLLPLWGFAETRITGVLLGPPPPGLEQTLDALNLRLGPELDARLELIYIGWNEVNSKYPLVLAGGEDIDFIYTASWAPYTTQAVRGAFRELTFDALKKTMPRHWEATPPEAWEQARVGGRIFMIPTATPDRKVPVAVIRGDLRKKYGLPPSDVSGLEPFLAAVKKNEPGLVPINLGNGYDIGQPFFALLNHDVPPIAAPFFGTVYGNYQDPAHGLVNLLDPPWRAAYVKAATVMKRWYDRGYFNRAPFANTVLSRESFVRGTSAVGFGNSQSIEQTVLAAQARGFDPEIIPILSSTGRSNADSYTGNGVAVAASSRNPEKTLQVLDKLMEDPVYIRLLAAGTGVEASGFWFVNKDLVPPAPWPPAYSGHRAAVKTLLVPNTFLDFAFVPTKVKNEIAAITTVMAQYGDVLSIGAVADVGKAVSALEAKLKAARQDKALAELQSQLADHYRPR